MLLFELETMHVLTDALHGNIRELTGNGYDRCRRTFSTFQQFARALQLCGCKIEDHRATARFGRGLRRWCIAVHSPRASVQAVDTSETTRTYLFYTSPWKDAGRSASY